MAIKYSHRLRGVDQKLKDLILEAGKGIDFSIQEGRRTHQRQLDLITTGVSRFNPSSAHLAPHVVGRAVDIVPIPFDGWGDLKGKHFERSFVDRINRERGRFYYLAGWIMSIASDMRIAIRWGGDWDGDGRFVDQRFDDLVHFELVR